MSDLNWIATLAEARFDVSDDGRTLTLRFAGLTPEAAENMRQFAVAAAVACKDIPTEALEAGTLAKALNALAALCGGGQAPIPSINAAIAGGAAALHALGRLR